MQRARYDLAIREAGMVDGRRMLRGVGNTFTLMRSRRLIHPDGVKAWLARNPTPRVPLFAQHGYVRSNFPNIGAVESIAVDEGGLSFAASVVEGTELADEAWKLIQQKALFGISLGWWSYDVRKMESGSKDTDPYVQEQLDRAGAPYAVVMMDFELVEISVVDAGDDARALLAARIDEGVDEDLEARIEAAIERGNAKLANKLADALGVVLTDRLFEMQATLSDPGLRSARLLLDGDDADAGDGQDARPTDRSEDRSHIQPGGCARHADPAARRAAIESARRRLDQVK